MHEVIRLHAEAPEKPMPGSVCNGCGVCCTTEPCPLGVVVSGRTTGRCDALLWRDEQKRYLCGLIEAPSAHLPSALGWMAPAAAVLARRYISAGSGCDCDVSAERASDVA